MYKLFLSIFRILENIKLFQSNWNNKILKIEYGSLYTSCVIVANLHKWILVKSLEAEIITVVLRMLKQDAMAKHSLLVRASREIVGWTPFSIFNILLF